GRRAWAVVRRLFVYVLTGGHAIDREQRDDGRSYYWNYNYSSARQYGRTWYQYRGSPCCSASRRAVNHYSNSGDVSGTRPATISHCDNDTADGCSSCQCGDDGACNNAVDRSHNGDDHFRTGCDSDACDHNSPDPICGDIPDDHSGCWWPRSASASSGR